MVVSPGSGTTALYDNGLSGTTFSTPLSYTLLLPTPTAGGSTTWDTAGADGQIGFSRSAFVAGEVTTINGTAVSGPGAPDSNSDWDGNSSLPLPQLWDNEGHDIQASTPSGTTELDVTIGASGDCLTTVENVVTEH